MQLNSQIACFIKVAEHQSFTLAAEQLHITPTAVSKQVKAFEAKLGEQLFIRTTRVVSLTEFGELLYERCKGLQSELDSIAQFIATKKGVPHGKLTVLVSTIMGKQILMPKLKAFYERYPEIELELIFSEEDDALKSQRYDIFVGFPQIPPYTDLLKYRKVAEVKNILCASPSYIKQHGEPKTAEDLLTAKFISHTLRAPQYALPLADGNKIMTSKPVMLMNNFDALNMACREGIGIFLTGDVLVAEDLAQGKLVQVLADYDFQHYDIYLFYRNTAYEIPKIRSLIEFLSMGSSLDI